MKDIKDYIGTKTAIHCKTQDEWDYIIQFDGDIHTKIHPSWFKSGGGDYIEIDNKEFYQETHPDSGFTIIPASDFMPTDEPQREIEGYKWHQFCKKYHSAAARIVDVISIDTSTDGIIFKDASEHATLLREAGVLELWFEPVYKEIKVWPKKGSPCLVWDDMDNRVQLLYSTGIDGFTLQKDNSSTSHGYDNYIELNITEEQLSKLP